MFKQLRQKLLIYRSFLSSLYRRTEKNSNQTERSFYTKSVFSYLNVLFKNIMDVKMTGVVLHAFLIVLYFTAVQWCLGDMEARQLL